jgi:UDP-N-acetylmuramoyl-tripeptide--D-alanyl-D-alanine ligase
MMRLQQAASYLPCASLVGDGNVTIKRVHTDTRSVLPGDLFVAIQGDRFDAHTFLAEAKAKGAVAAIAQHGLAEAGLAGLQVADSKVALGELAAHWRAQFDLPLIAVTGSNGKTTVTQMIASILRAWKPDGAFATEGNFNNDIGLPLTLLRLNASHRIGVIEMGMNHPGEIACLANIAKPTVAVVNNAQREHLEFMATVAAVADENGAVISALPANGIAVFPADDDYAPVWRALAGARPIVTFALSGLADVTAQSLHWAGDAWQVVMQTPAGRATFSLNIAGQHNVKNALAASACALAAGVSLASIATGLTNFLPVAGRSRSTQIRSGSRLVTLVDDTYNANPDSMQAAIAVLADLPSPRVLIMGDMGEVGEQGPQFHREAGAQARDAGIETLLTLGEQSQAAAQAFGDGQHFNDAESLIAAALTELHGAGSVLVKGSRFMKMERVIRAITEKIKEQSREEPHAT